MTFIEFLTLATIYCSRGNNWQIVDSCISKAERCWHFERKQPQSQAFRECILDKRKKLK